MSVDAAILAGLGEIEEYSGGDRVLLPISYYIMNIPDVDAIEASAEGGESGDNTRANITDIDGNDVLTGGTPFCNVQFNVTEGPFEGCSMKPRLYFTPGKGRNIGFINSMVKGVTGQSVDLAAIREFNFIMPQAGSPDEIQEAFAKNFYTLSAEDRVAFMSQYCRWGQWAGQDVVVKVGHEDGRPDEATGVTPIFNRALGFYTLDHTKKGAAYVRNTCHAEQEAEGKAQGILS